MDTVVSLGHVRDETTSEIAIAETRDFFLKRDSKPHLQAPTEAELARDRAVVDHERDHHEHDKSPHDTDAVLGKSEERSELEKRPEQNSLDDNRGGAAGKRRDEGRGREEPVFADPRPKLPPRPGRLFVTRRLDRPRNRRRGDSLARGRPVESQEYRAPDHDLVINIRPRRIRRCLGRPIALGDGVGIFK